MYSLSDLREGINNPARIVGELRKYSYKFNSAVHSLSPKEGLHVMDEDWDNLIILDAARYDIFEEITDFNEELLKQKSLGSSSIEFITENFVGNEHHDTVYVTANPYYELLGDNVFHDVIPLMDEWDNQSQTVLPEDVVSAAIKTNSNYPNKRLIVHFMQPHIPFIGSKGRRINTDGWNPGAENDEQMISCWTTLMYGYRHDFSESDVREAYVENHKIAIEHASKLQNNLTGKTVITADHANLIGERMSPIPARAYGHFVGLREPPLIEVPWQPLTYDKRKQIESEPPTSEIETMNQEERNMRLEALGYK